MRLGAPVFCKHDDPEAYVQAHRQRGYTAAYCPDGLNVNDGERVGAFARAFAENDLLLAEVGAWRNPVAKDEQEAKQSMQYVAERLALADELGAVCCVNIVGSASGENWFGPAQENYTEDFFAMCVEANKKIIDMVKPKRTKLAFEMVPYNFIDSPQEMQRFVRAVDRPAAGVHVDFTNCVTSPRIYYNNTALIREMFSLLGDSLLSMHCKDIHLRTGEMTVMFAEVAIGQGAMDYRTLLSLAAKLPENTPLMLEHLPGEADYDMSAAGIRKYAAQAGVNFK